MSDLTETGRSISRPFVGHDTQVQSTVVVFSSSREGRLAFDRGLSAARLLCFDREARRTLSARFASVDARASDSEGVLQVGRYRRHRLVAAYLDGPNRHVAYYDIVVFPMRPGDVVVALRVFRLDVPLPMSFERRLLGSVGRRG